MIFKKIKKLAALGLTVALGATTLTGCGSTASNESSSDVVTLKYYSIGAEPKDKQAVLAEANKYLGEKNWG